MSIFTYGYEWQSNMRTAGVLMKLQATPFDKTTTSLAANPKKASGSVVSQHDRELYPEWPSGTVYKVRVPPNVFNPTGIENTLELEVSSTGYAYPCTGVGASIALIDSLVALDTGIGFKYDDVWTGGDNQCYRNVTFYNNRYGQADLDGDGILDDYWDVTTQVYEIDGSGTSWGLVSSSVAAQQSSPTTIGTACAYNGTSPYSDFFSEPNNSLYGVFSDIIYANEFAELFAKPSAISLGTAAFCLRKSDDQAHGLTPYIKYDSVGAYPYGWLKTSRTSGEAVNLIMSVRESTTQTPIGLNNYYDTTCRWYYTPASSCAGDCWYAGKTVTVEITYKEAQIQARSYTYTPEEGVFDNDITYTLGSWATHSTVTQTLVLPSGTTRQAINAAFDVPTKNGYVVAIDDIKLVSVT